MKKNLLLLTVVALTCLIACSSPESNGKKMAEKFNRCFSSCLETLQENETHFISNFSNAGYRNRADAKNAYRALLDETYAGLQRDLAALSNEETQYKLKYTGNRKSVDSYETAYSSHIDYGQRELVEQRFKATEIPEGVRAAIRTLIPPKPGPDQIQSDLVGHSLEEGVVDGYHDSHWRWKILEGEISNFSIDQVISDSAQEYMVIASLRLTSEVGKAYDAKVKIRYTLPKDDDWTIEYALSQGMYIVKSNKYTENIKITTDNLFHVPILNNQSDIALEVGGRKLSASQWSKFSVVIKPHSSCDLYANEIIIDYVERP